MSSRKKRATLDHWSAADYSGRFTDRYGNECKESFARIPESLLQSLAFRYLKHRQQILLVCIEAKGYGHIKPCDDVKHPAHDLFKDRKDTFYITFDDVSKRYGLYAEKSFSDFYRVDIPALIEHGFIKKLWSGKGRQKSIFCYSDDWITWRPQPPPT